VGDALLILGIVALSNLLLWTGYLITRAYIEVDLLVCATPVTIVGGLAVLAGTIGTMVCRQQLGRLWSAQTMLLADHWVVESGAYRVVRHPIYACACLMTVGTVLVFATWWNILAGALVLILYGAKATREERALAAGLPGYRAYQKRVRYRLAPWIW
jgi:protein-S-isoprenylcysteine O-methyltransferase Ste14